MNKPAKLSETELEVMEVMWNQKPPVTVSHLLQIFKEEKGWKTSTLSTLLARLMEKGYLTKTLLGKVNQYTPIITRQQHQNLTTRAFLEDVHRGSVKSFLASLADDELTNQELEELKTWFQQKYEEKP